VRTGIRPAGGPFIPIAEITLRASRSSGPGGQHANVTASRIEAVFDLRDSTSLNQAQRDRITRKLGPVVTAIAQDNRSQARNRELALARLEQKLAGALAVPRRRRPTRPTRASGERRLKSKKVRSDRKKDRRRPSQDGY
jgi:ribosome-associated protein